MSRATVISFCQTQGIVGLDSSSLGDFYDAFVKELGYIGLLTNFTTVAGVSGTGTYNSPAQVVDLYYVHWKNAAGGSPYTYIPFTELHALEASNRDWRAATNTTPVTRTDEEDVKENSFTLYPTPDNNGTLTIIYSETRTNVPAWREQVLAYEILAREFARESKYQDTAMPDPARFMSKLYATLVI